MQQDYCSDNAGRARPDNMQLKYLSNGGQCPPYKLSQRRRARKEKQCLLCELCVSARKIL